MDKSEIKYIGEQIKDTLRYISNIRYDLYLRPQIEDDYKSDVSESLLYVRIRDLYFLILAYLEAQGMSSLFDIFHNRYAPVIDDDNELKKEVCYHPEDESELKILNDFEQFLKAFSFFDNHYHKNEESGQLISILRNTDHILKNCNVEVHNEADIYKQVKWVLGLYYPKCRNKNKAAFIQQFKTYNPDILIPELKTAIEYKYINSLSDNIDEFIDQIKIDSTNYIGDSNYEYFIAVIYIEDISMATNESIEASWKAKNFPKNWELVVVNGSPTKKKK
ncbi:MAG: hypothetical protein QM751_09345 [Paludibacteraceae bacterium]